jgi:rhodanese-related sulfurtransferase
MYNCSGRFTLFGSLLILVVGLLLFAGRTAAQSSVSDDTSTLAITIDSEHLIELYQSFPGLTIIDSRLESDHALGHIETSISLPLSQTNCKTLKELAKSPEQAMVFYGNNKAGTASIEAIRIASGCGYNRLFWLRGGFVEWKEKDYPYVIE